MVLWSVIGRFRSVLRVSVLQGSLLVIVIMIDGSEKRNCESGFWTLEFPCLWKAQLRWLAAAKNANVSWLLNFRVRRVFLKSAVINLTNFSFIFQKLMPSLSLKDHKKIGNGIFFLFLNSCWFIEIVSWALMWRRVFTYLQYNRKNWAITCLCIN